MSDDRPATPDAPIDAVIADLARLRSTDPAARHAVHAIKLTGLTLESFGRPTRRPEAGAGFDETDGA